MKKYDLYVSPTLIDSFLWYERMGNDPIKFKELIDKINKVPIEYPESAKKGVAFEDCVNLTLSGQPTFSKDDFKFDEDLVLKISNKLRNNTGSQKWIERNVNFKHGVFRVGGFIDFNYVEKTVDLKTCKQYKLGKYSDNSQHRAYGLIEPGKKEIIYLVTDFDNVYIEPYANKTKNHEEFIYNVEKFYKFAKDNEHLFNDKQTLFPKK